VHSQHKIQSTKRTRHMKIITKTWRLNKHTAATYGAPFGMLDNRREKTVSNTMSLQGPLSRATAVDVSSISDEKICMKLVEQSHYVSV